MDPMQYLPVKAVLNDSVTEYFCININLLVLGTFRLHSRDDFNVSQKILKLALGFP